ncbi:response regulator receiver protein [Pseudomonas sp. 21]|uniref:response regulator n=1 Tax=unclassified Pseudomonas TaxID=196821 RepID=UPI0005EBCEF3|nr:MULTISPECIES: response regulator [unclassified Pseudomonas]KJJ96084.1 response regulator receiver protein [Pseudomonas sp. 21]MBV7586701.1 response regulator [Pseudomonas sp. PDM33]
MSKRVVLNDEELQALRDITARAPRRPVVLLVDDDRAVLARTRRLIERANLRCLTASSAALALRRIQREEAAIDLLISGLGLERDGPGRAFIQKLNESGTFLPIIMLSARTDLGEDLFEASLNVLDFLPKPVDPASFLHVLSHSL